MEEKLEKDFANSDTVRNVRSTKVKDAFSKNAFSKDAFVDARSSNGDFFGNLRRKKRSAGYNPNFGGQIKKAGDFDSDAIQSALQSAMEEKLKEKFDNSDTGRNERNTRIKDNFSKDASDIGDQIFNDAIQSAIQSAIEEKLKEKFANSDAVRQVRNTKVKDAISRVSKARGQTFSDVRDFGSKLY